MLLLFFVLSKVVIWLLFNKTLCRTRFLSHEHSTNSPIEQAFAIVKAMPAAVIAFTKAVSRVSGDCKQTSSITIFHSFFHLNIYLSTESFSCSCAATCSSIYDGGTDSRILESPGWCLWWFSSAATSCCDYPACKCREFCWGSSVFSCMPASGLVKCCFLRPCENKFWAETGSGVLSSQIVDKTSRLIIDRLITSDTRFYITQSPARFTIFLLSFIDDEYRTASLISSINIYSSKQIHIPPTLCLQIFVLLNNRQHDVYFCLKDIENFPPRNVRYEWVMIYVN